MRRPSRSSSSTPQPLLLAPDDDDQRHDRDESDQIPKHCLPRFLLRLCLLSGPNSRRGAAAGKAIHQ